MTTSSFSSALSLSLYIYIYIISLPLSACVSRTHTLANLVVFALSLCARDSDAPAIFGLRMKYDESDNIFVRAARSMTDTLADKFGWLG